MKCSRKFIKSILVASSLSLFSVYTFANGFTKVYTYNSGKSTRVNFQGEYKYTVSMSSRKILYFTARIDNSTHRVSIDVSHDSTADKGLRNQMDDIINGLKGDKRNVRLVFDCHNGAKPKITKNSTGTFYNYKFRTGQGCNLSYAFNS